MKKDELTRRIGIGMLGICAIAFGACGNLSHNKHTTGALASAHLEMVEQQEEESREAEKEYEISTEKPKVSLTQEYQAEAYITSAYITTIEPTEAPTTTTVAETTIVTTEEPTEAPTTAYIEPTTVTETVAQTVTQVLGYTSDEILLMQIASCEAYSQGPVGQALVMRVILNRCASSCSDVTSVIYAPRQFTSVNTQLFQSGYISPDAYQAIELIRSGWDASNGALYFVAARAYNPNGWFGTLQMLFQYGDHIFFK